MRQNSRDATHIDIKSIGMRNIQLDHAYVRPLPNVRGRIQHVHSEQCISFVWILVYTDIKVSSDAASGVAIIERDIGLYEQRGSDREGVFQTVAV